MKNISLIMENPTLMEVRDFLNRLYNQLAESGSADDWVVFCNGCDPVLNVDYKNHQLIFDDEELFTDYEDDDDYDDYDDEDCD